MGKATVAPMAEVEAAPAQAEEAQIAEEMGIFQICLRKNEGLKFILDVTPDTTIQEIKSMIINEVYEVLLENGSTETKTPFSENQVDIYDLETNKIIFACKKLSSIGAAEGDEYRWNVRQWGETYDTRGYGRTTHGAMGRSETQNHTSPRSMQKGERGKLCPTLHHTAAHKQFGDGW